MFQFRLSRLSVLTVLALAAWACGGEGAGPVATYEYTAPEAIGDGWATAAVGDVGGDRQLIVNMFNRFLDNTYTNIHSVLVIKDGVLLVEEYFPGPTVFGQFVQWNRDRLHNMHSASKSFASAFVGIAIDEGLIGGVTDPIADHLPTYADVFEDPAKAALRLEHLLPMASGLQWDEWSVPYETPTNSHTIMDASPDPVRYVLERPMAFEPGERFVYNSGISITLGRIVEGASGQDLERFALEHLYRPLGITSYHMTRYANGVYQMGGGLRLRPRDMAKFGQLFLDGGRWNGEQVVSEAWVHTSTTELGPNARYAYQWWLGAETVDGQTYPWFSAQGRGGQFIFVFPDLDLVAVFTGGNDNARVWQPIELLQRFIIPAFL